MHKKIRYQGLATTSSLPGWINSQGGMLGFIFPLSKTKAKRTQSLGKQVALAWIYPKHISNEAWERSPWTPVREYEV